MKDKILKGFIYVNTAFITLIALWIVVWILMSGVSYLNLDLFAFKYSTKNLSMLPAIVNTLTFIVLTLFVAVPIGIATSIYFVEYNPASSIIVKSLRFFIETLAGIPSIIYGLFGYLFFVLYLKLGFTVLSGSLTLSIMILPVIIRTCEESLLNVDKNIKLASFALGASKIRTIFMVVLPSASSGIINGIMLGVGRIVGESALLIYTAGTIAQIAGPFDSGRSLSIHIYSLISEGIYIEQAKATSVVLLFIVILMNIFLIFFNEKRK